VATVLGAADLVLLFATKGTKDTNGDVSVARSKFHVKREGLLSCSSAQHRERAMSAAIRQFRPGGGLRWHERPDQCPELPESVGGRLGKQRSLPHSESHERASVRLPRGPSRATKPAPEPSRMAARRSGDFAVRAAGLLRASALAMTSVAIRRFGAAGLLRAPTHSQRLVAIRQFGRRDCFGHQRPRND
jgi:hypothetical protein